MSDVVGNKIPLDALMGEMGEGGALEGLLKGEAARREKEKKKLMVSWEFLSGQLTSEG